MIVRLLDIDDTGGIRQALAIDIDQVATVCETDNEVGIYLSGGHVYPFVVSRETRGLDALRAALKRKGCALCAGTGAVVPPWAYHAAMNWRHENPNDNRRSNTPPTREELEVYAVLCPSCADECLDGSTYSSDQWGIRAWYREMGSHNIDTELREQLNVTADPSARVGWYDTVYSADYETLRQNRAMRRTRGR